MNDQLQLDLEGIDFGIASTEGEPKETAAATVPVPAGVKLTYEDFDFEGLLTYAGIDCINTSGILGKLWPELNKVETMKVVKGASPTIVKAAPIVNSVIDIEMPAHEFILDLEINGIGYSKQRNKFYNLKMEAEVAELDDRIFSAIGKKINLDSGPVVAEFLYVTKGLKPPSMTKAGEPATDGEALLTLAGLDPMGGKYVAPDSSLQWLADMAKRKDINSVRNTFIKTYVEDWVKRTGRIHPSYNLFGTSSFRITGSDPNLTQLPRAKHGYNVRTCFTTRPGTVFISFDFSSAEVKILANMAKEPAMLKAIADGLDFHTFSASAMRGIPYDEMFGVLQDRTHSKFKEYKELRQLAKVLTFSILYGASTAGIAAQLYLSIPEAQRLIDLYFSTFPKVRDFIESSHRMAQWNQFVITPLNQRKRQYGTYSCFKGTAAFNAALRNSQNVLIQSTTSSVGLITFAELNERIKPFGAISTCTVYDSLEIECPIQNAAQVINLCYDVLDNWPVETFDFLELPIGCEGDVGISWGETEVVHPGTTTEDVLAIVERCKASSVKTFGELLLDY